MTYDDQQVFAAAFTRRPSVCQAISSRDPAFPGPSQLYADGETIFAEIDLNEDHTVDDVFCTCGAGGLCVHLTAMMYDMVERDTIRLSELENE